MSEEATEAEGRSQAEVSTTAADLEDKRFEVKWHKKETSTPATAKAEEADGAEAPAPDQLRVELEQAREQVEQLRDRWQRSAADLANLRRRTEEEKGEVEKFANMLLVAELLPVLDNFERALATIPGNLAMLTWIHGVLLIDRQLRGTLERQGLTEVQAGGQQFNPALHEAIAEKETNEAPPGSIVQVYQKGYELGGRLIRPALVEIAKAPKAEVAESEAQVVESTTQEAATENVGP